MWSSGANQGDNNIYNDVFIQQSSGRVFYQEYDGKKKKALFQPNNVSDGLAASRGGCTHGGCSHNVSIYIDGALSQNGTNLNPNVDRLRIAGAINFIRSKEFGWNAYLGQGFVCWWSIQQAKLWSDIRWNRPDAIL